MTGSFRSHHTNVVTGARLNVTETDIETVGEEKRGIRFQIRGNLLRINRPLHLIRGKNHHDIPFGGCLLNRFDL